MRIVSHPNIVELKAFYYSNGERVSKPIKWSNNNLFGILMISNIER